MEWADHLRRNHARLNRKDSRANRAGPRKRCDFCGDQVDYHSDLVVIFVQTDCSNWGGATCERRAREGDFPMQALFGRRSCLLPICWDHQGNDWAHGSEAQGCELCLVVHFSNLKNLWSGWVILWAHDLPWNPVRSYLQWQRLCSERKDSRIQSSCSGGKYSLRSALLHWFFLRWKVRTIQSYISHISGAS